jgi:1-acyl-sn-glycerol-3-phosphate acyltransferase
VPLFGRFLRLAGYFPIDRAVVLSAYRMVEQIIASLKEGESVMIFPEGTRSRDGSLGAFKRGSLMAALKAGAPIVPVAIDGSYKFMPRGTWLLQPTEASLSVAPPVYIKNEAEYDAKVAEVRNAIAARLPQPR